ncbi:MAG: hypothetical protein AB7I38_14365 [Dehalococcoidia bacterium]
MGNFVFNRSKGRFAEFAERVNANDPANSVFVIDVLATSGIESDATLLDKDDFAALVSGTTNFVTQSSIRKTIDQTGGLTITYDDTNDRVDVDCPDQTWTAVAAGDGWNDIVFGYDSDSTAGTDANILPVTQHDFVVTPDGSDITATVAVFARAA